MLKLCVIDSIRNPSKKEVRRMQYKVCLSKTVALQDISYEHLHKEIDLKSLSVRFNASVNHQNGFVNLLFAMK